MNALILNRDYEHPTDGWYMIEPKGEHLNAAAGVVQVVDRAAMESIANRFEAEIAKPNFAGLLIDHEHFRHQPDKETRAFGWLTNIKPREDGLYGQIRWSATGKAAVDGGDYRFFSTEYSTSDLEVLSDGRPKKVRPRALAGLTLTNDPNNRGGKPITNRASDTEDKPEKKSMKTVATALGLAPEASEDSIREAVIVINRRATDAETALTALKTEVANLKTLNESYGKDRVDAELEKLDAEPIKNRVNAEQREAWAKILGFNFEVGRKALAGFIESNKPAATVGRPITNRATAKPPETQDKAPSNENERAQIFNRKVRDYMGSHPGVSFIKADQIISRENPELLKPVAADA